MRPEELTPRQQQDIILAHKDHARFCRESLRLRERSGSLVPLESWPSQTKLNRAIREQQDAGKPVRIIVLKTRRSGFTVGASSHVFRETVPFPGRRASVIADKYDPAALEAFGYFQQFHAHYMPYNPLDIEGCSIGLPQIRVVKGDMKFYRGDEVILDVFSAESGEIRGGGRHWLILDEVAFWRAAQQTLRSAMNMVPDLPETGILILSTANGVGGEFYEMCQRAQAPTTADGWKFLFFGWLEDENNSKLFKSVEDMNRLMRSLDKEERTLRDFHQANPAQLHWRRWKIGTSFNGDVAGFHQEYPTTPDEAWLTSGRPALDHAALSRMPVTEGISGELSQLDEPPRPRLIWTPREQGALTVWKRPEPGRWYVAGADPSQGKDVSEAQRGDDPDWAVMGVLDGETGYQVAQLRARIRPASFAEYACMVARWYNYAFLVPESNDAGFIDAVLIQNYPLERIYNRRRDPSDRRTTQPQEIGWQTTTATRPWLVSALDSAIRDGSIAISSAIAVQECRTFVIKPNGKAEHQQGCHDDCVLMLALCVMGMRFAPRPVMTSPPVNPFAQTVSKYGRQSNTSDDEESDRYVWKSR